MNMSARSTLAVLLGILLLAGCGGGRERPAYLADLVPVTGTVRLDGKAVAGMEVTFTPVQGSAKTAIGRTNEAGVYTLCTPPGGTGINPANYPGALPGEYKVTFSRFLLPDGTPWDSRNSKEGPMNVGAMETIPVRLTNPQTTPETVTILSEGPQSADFEIKPAR